MAKETVKKSAKFEPLFSVDVILPPELDPIGIAIPPGSADTLGGLSNVLVSFNQQGNKGDVRIGAGVLVTVTDQDPERIVDMKIKFDGDPVGTVYPVRAKIIR